MNILYRNSSGKDVTHSSYSSRQTFKHCPREFQLTRVHGWWSKEQRAATLFGRCIEAGLQAYEENHRKEGSGIECFKRMWNDVKLLPEFDKLIYTASEGSWDQLLGTGQQMMKLYEIRAPRLPITNPLFQQKLRKKIFPGTNLDALENVAILDILSFPAWDHKSLPWQPPVPAGCDDCAVRWSCSLEADGPKYEPCPTHRTRELIIDVKTSGKDFPSDLVALDPQLAEYAWQTRIPDVAFLWFVKRGHSLKKGDKVSTLAPAGELWAGWEGFVIETGEPDEAGRMWVYLGSWDTLQKFETGAKGLRGKVRDAFISNFLDAGRAGGSITAVSDQDVTKQRIQFAAARLTEEEMNDVGKSVAQTTVEMVRAHEMDFYEKQPGVRFPNEKCNFCSMRWICLNRPEERDKNLSKKGEEWLDGNYEEDNG
jgi:hypothetical protein